MICLSLDYLDIFLIVLSLDFLRKLPEFHCSSSCAKSKQIHWSTNRCQPPGGKGVNPNHAKALKIQDAEVTFSMADINTSGHSLLLLYIFSQSILRASLGFFFNQHFLCLFFLGTFKKHMVDFAYPKKLSKARSKLPELCDAKVWGVVPKRKRWQLFGKPM